jgi:hypothetical protein
LVVDNVVQHPMACPSDYWEFAPVDATSVVLINTSQVPVAYTAASSWNIAAHYVPGV